MDALSALQRLGGGKLLEELYQALLVTAEEVVATGKPGTVTLKLQASTQQQGDPMVLVTEQISRSAPKKEAKGAYFFAVDGDLHREDPRQARMEFTVVDTRTGEIRDVSYPEKAERIID